MDQSNVVGRIALQSVVYCFVAVGNWHNVSKFDQIFGLFADVFLVVFFVYFVLKHQGVNHGTLRVNFATSFKMIYRASVSL